MNRFVAVMIAVYSPVLFAQTSTESVKAYEHNTIEYRFVGLTPETTDGSVRIEDGSGNSIYGVAAMHRLCQKSYGNEARAATIQEVYFRNEKHRDMREAWVAPSGPISILPSGEDYIPVDASTGNIVGRAQPSQLYAMTSAYCQQYTKGLEDTEATLWDGPVSSSQRQIFRRSCDTEHAVACSIPVRITATGLTKVTNGNYEK